MNLKAVLSILFLTLAALRAPAQTTFSWTNTVSTATNSWSAGGNWLDGGAPVSGSNTIIYFAQPAPAYVTSNDITSLVLNQLNFSNSAVTILGNGLTFSNSAAFPRINQFGDSNAVIAVPLALTTNLTVGGTGTGTITFSGPISGAGSLTMLGTNFTLVLSTVYTASTINVSAGTLLIGAGTAGDAINPSTRQINISSNATLRLGVANPIQNAVTVNVSAGGLFDMGTNADVIGFLAGAGTVTNNGGLTLDLGLATNTFSGVIGGANGLTVRGINAGASNGVQVLSGVNTYTGNTTINTGILRIASSTALGNTTNITVTAMGSLQLSNVTVTARLVLSGGNIGVNNGAVVSIIGGGTTTINSNINLTGGTSIKITSGAGTRLVINGGVTGNNNSLGLYDDAGTTGIIVQTTAINLGTGTLSTHGSVINVASNTIGFLAIDWGNRTVLNVDNPFVGAPGLRIGTSSSSAPTTLDLNGHNLLVNSLNSAGSGTHISNYIVSATAATLTVSNTTVASWYGGQITGAVALVKSGTGTLVLAGTNSYTGGTVVNNGVLQFNNTNAIPALNSVTINSGGAAAVGYVMDQAFLNRISANSSGAVALTVSSGNALDFTSLTNVSLGAVGSVFYTGTITPAASTYLLGGGGGTLYLTNDLALVDSGGSRSLTIGGAPAGVVFLNGSNTFSGGTVLNSSTLSISREANIGGYGATLTINGGTLQIRGTAITNLNQFAGGNVTNIPSSATFDINNSGNNFTVGSMLTVTGVFSKAGRGVLVLAASNNFVGAVNVNSGVVSLQHGDALAGSTGTVVASGAAIQLSGGNTYASVPVTLNGTGIANDGALRSVSDGNVYLGTITLAAGSRLISDVGTLVVSNVVEAGATPWFGGAGTITIAGVLSGNQNVYKIGSGTLQLINTNADNSNWWTVYDGTLLADFTALGYVTNNIIGSGGKGMNLSGGTLMLIGKNGTTNTQGFAGGNTGIQAGNSRIVVTNGASGSVVLNLSGTLNRSAAGLLDFTLPGSGAITMTTTTNSSGIIGGWATVGGANWASTLGTTVSTYNAYSSTSGGLITSNATSNVKITAGGSYGIDSVTTVVNSLLVSASGAVTITNNGATLRLGAAANGGVLLPLMSGGLTIGASANDGYFLAGGSAANTAGELIFINNSPSNITVNAAVINNGNGANSVTIGGSGTGGVTFNGNNNFTGKVTVNSGLVTFNGSTNTMLGGVTLYGGTVLFTPNSTNLLAIAGSQDLILNRSSTVIIGGPTMITGSYVYVGNSGVLDRGVLIVSNTLNMSAVGRIMVGAAANSAGAIYLNGGTIVGTVAPNQQDFAIGGQNAGAYGYVNITSGTLNYNEIGVGGGGQAGYGVLEMSGGYITNNTPANSYFYVTRNNNESGVMFMSGGTLTAPSHGIQIANFGTGGFAAMTLTGTANIDSPSNTPVLIGNGANINTAILNLNGGTLQANAITGAGIGSVLNFNGGCFRAASNHTAWISGVSVYVMPVGAVLDDNGMTVTVGSSLQGPTGYGLTNIALASWGGGYIGAPIVQITGGNGTGASAYAQVDLTSGQVTNILITSAGSGYLRDDALTIQLIGGGPTNAAVLGAFSFGLNSNTGGLTKLGSGTLIFTNVNTYGGATIVSNGVLQYASARTNVLNGIRGSGTLAQSGWGPLVLNGDNTPFAGTLAINTGVVFFTSLATAPTNNNVLINPAGAAAFDFAGVQNVITTAVKAASTGAIALTAANANENLNFNAPGFTNVFLGAIGTITFGGTYTPFGSTYRFGGGGGTLLLTNQYSGNIVVSPGAGAAGAVQAGIANLFDPASDVTVNSGVRFDVNGYSQALGSLAGNGLIVNATNVAATLTVGGNNNSTTFGGTIAGPIGLTKAGTGTLTLTNANTYTGLTIISGGTLQLTANGTNLPGFWQGSLPGSFDQTTANPRTNSLLTPITLTPFMANTNAKPPWGDNVTWVYTATLYNNTGTNVTWTFGGSIDDSEKLVIDGITLFNDGTWNTPDRGNITLAPGAHSFELRVGNGGSGAGMQMQGWWTNVNFGAGVDFLGRNAAMITNYVGYGDTGNGALFTTGLNILPGATTVVISNGAALDLNGAWQAITALSGPDGGLVTNTAASASRLSLGPLAGSNYTYSGVIGDDAVNTISLDINGPGIQTLTGTNAYYGPTAIRGGVLRADFGVGLPVSTAIILTGGVWETGLDIINFLDISPGCVQISGASGFSAYGNPINVNINNDGGTLVWSNGTFFNPTTFILNAFSANTNLTLLNGLDLNGAVRTVQVSAAQAFIPGDITSSVGYGGLVKIGAGTLTLSGTDAFGNSLNVNNGWLVLSNNSVFVDIGGSSPVRLGNAASDFGTLTMSSGATMFGRTNSGLCAGNSGKGVFIVQNNTIVSNRLVVGNNAGSAGAIYQSGGVILNTCGPTYDGIIGYNGFGYQELIGGALTNQGYAGLGYNGSGVGVFGQFGGSFYQIGDRFDVARNGTGAVYVAGGTFASAVPLNVAGPSGAASGRGEFTVTTNGLVRITNNVSIGNIAGQVGILNLNGGTLQANQITGPTAGALAILNLNGGLLRANAGSTAFIQGLDAVYVYGGGAILDSSNNTITVAQSLLAPTGSGVTSIAFSPLGGYLGAPYVQFSGGGGTGATAIALFNSASGTVTGIVITSAGVDYSSAPTVTLVGGGNTNYNLGAAALAPNTSGGLTKLGTGTLILSNNNTYTGATVLNAGTLQLGAGGASGSILDTNLVVPAGSWLGYNRSDTYTNGIVISGNGGFYKAGAGTLVMPTTNSYLGNTLILGGTLRADLGIGLGSAGNITLSNAILETGAAFTNGLGTGGAQVQLPGGTAGFSAFGSPVTVNLGGAGAMLQWTNQFNPSTLILNGATANALLTFANGLNINGGNRTIQVSTNIAVITGILTNTGASATLTKTGGGTLVLQNTNTYNGTVTVTGGALVFDGNTVVSTVATNTRAINMYGNATLLITNNANVFLNGGLALGSASGQPGANVIQSSGTLVINGIEPGDGNRGLQLGEWPSESSTYTMLGGALIVTNGVTYVPWHGTNSFFNISGGSVMLKQVIFGQSATQTGTLNLNGGTLTIGSGGLTALATPAAQINLGGGTLGAYAPWSTALPINLTNINGGATIDTTGGAITLTGILSGIGGFTKAGAGTLTLTRTNTYSGPTLINSGTLALGTGAASIGTPRFELLGGAFLDATAPGLRLAPGQELKGSGTVLGTVIADTGATITPGNSIGTLTLDTLILTNGPALRFELGATNNSDIVVVNSTLTLEGMVTNWFVLTATNGFDVGTYTLFQASLIVGQLGAETNFTSVGDSGMPGYLFLDGNNVRLEVIPEPGAGMLVAAGLLATLLLRRRRA